jgi:anti-sigma regulatory factor (Ser/Thr protein kinase)
MGAVWVRNAPASASTVRRTLLFELGEYGCTEDVAYDVALIASELVGNAVRHARPLPSGHLHVEWKVEDDSVRIAISDGGSDHIPTELHVSPTDLSGRGLAIVAAVADDWGVATDLNGTTVWATRSLHDRPGLTVVR